MGGPEILIAAMAGLGIIAIFVPAYVVLQGRMSSQSRLRQRCMVMAHTIRRSDEAKDANSAKTRQRLIQGKIRELEKQRSTNKRNTIRHLLIQCGSDMTIQVYITLSVLVGLVSGLILWIGMRQDPMAATIGAVGAGFTIPRFVLGKMVSRRQNKFIQHFGDALDILVRGTRTGLPAGECMRIASREVPDPVGYEFRMLVEAQRVGMTLEQALERALERVPIAEMQFFSIVLLVQQQTGGNLASTLENLSNVLRSRRRLKEKVKALSAEANVSAGIIGCLPFLVGFFIFLASPDFIGVLFTSRMGYFLIGGGLTWMTCGVIVMRSMINFKL